LCYVTWGGGKGISLSISKVEKSPRLLRNKFVHIQGGKEPKIVLEDARGYLYEFRRALNLEVNSETQTRSHPVNWERPAAGKLKLNVDVACFKNLDFMGVGGIIQDHPGAVSAGLRQQDFWYF
ncbi:hypothetical protein TorRG33x02_341190, partial [Trema orientale]